MNLCQSMYDPPSSYSETFLAEFEKSYFFDTCKNELNGMLKWNDWQKCTQSCTTSDSTCGAQIRVAITCEPSYAVCSDMPIEQRNCGCETCQYRESSSQAVEVPIGTILPWVPKPNELALDSVSYDEWQGWIKETFLKSINFNRRNYF